MRSIRPLLLLVPLCLVGAAGGCTSAVQSGHNTALDSMDLQTMTDQMAAGLAASPAVAEAFAAGGPLRVVVQPVENRMTAEILPAGQAYAFTARVRHLLSRQAPDRFTWVMNRDAFNQLRQTELEGILGPSPDAVNPRYCLWATFHSLTKEDADRRTSAYLCVFELTDLERRTTLWTHEYQVQKVAVKGTFDR